jgi:hypothetical protein
VSSSQTTNPLTHISNAFNHSTQPQATLQRTQTVSGPSVDALHEMIQSMYTFTQETWNELESKQNEFQRMIHLYTCTPVHPYTRTPVHQYTRTPIHPYTYTPIHLYTYTPIYRMILNVYGIKLIRKTTIIYSYTHTLFINPKHP